MNTVIIAFNYVEFKDTKKYDRQRVAMQVMNKSPEWAYPVSFEFKSERYNAEHNGVFSLNLLKRNSRVEIGNDRDLPYVKEILDWSSKIDCDKIGYINSDILLGDKFYDAIGQDYDAYIFSRSDIVDTTCTKFCNQDFKVIYGGDKHIGADGFFFKKDWWLKNRHLFPDGLILGETEWDTCYRKIISEVTNNYLEKRVLYHVYHDAKWTLDSVGAKNNIAIWERMQ